MNCKIYIRGMLFDGQIEQSGENWKFYIMIPAHGGLQRLQVFEEKFTLYPG